MSTPHEPPPRPGLLRLYSENTPSTNDPKGSDVFYKELGILIVAWGRLEGHMVTCLISAFSIAMDAKIGLRVPNTWEQRAEKWKAAFTTVASLKPIEALALEILDEVQDVAKDRNLLVHAFWEFFSREGPLTIGIVSIKSKSGTKDGLEVRREIVSVANLREISAKANSLNMKLHQVSGFLAQLRGPPPSDAYIV